MSRNSAGTYTLPAGNPVVSGTTITPTWANTTLSDLATELTNSLDRAGRGAMTAPLALPNGAAGAPALTFGTDPDTGLYRAGSDDVRMQVDGTQAQQWSAAGVAIPGTAAVTGAVTAAAGVTATQSTANSNAVTATGNGSGTGVSATGGATSGAGLYGTGGAPNGPGLTAVGTGTGHGGVGTGGAGGGYGFVGNGGATDGIGVYGAGGATNGPGVQGQGAGTGAGSVGLGGPTNGTGVVGIGAGTGAGGRFQAGTDATAAARQVAVTLSNGDLDLSGVADPNSNVAMSDRLTGKNLVKVWGYIETDGVGGVSLGDGFNIASVAITSGKVRITFASAMASTNYAVLLSPTRPLGGAIEVFPREDGSTRTASRVDITAALITTGDNESLATIKTGFSVAIIGAQ